MRLDILCRIGQEWIGSASEPATVPRRMSIPLSTREIVRNRLARAMPRIRGPSLRQRQIVDQASRAHAGGDEGHGPGLGPR